MKKQRTEKNYSDFTIIVGCGRLGASLANMYSDLGGSITIIDKDPSSFSKLSPSYGGITMIGDATEIDVLTEAKIESAKTVISVTNKDNTNIMVAQLAKELFNTERVIARLYDPECECVYQELDIDTICPAVLSAKEIDKLMGVPEQDVEVI